MNLETRIFWLKCAAGFTFAFGLFFLISLFTPLGAINTVLFDLVIGPPLDGAQSLQATETRLLIAITGGLMAGLAAAAWMLADTIYRNDPALGRRWFATTFLTWYAIDSTGSVIAGAPMNVLSNTVFLALFLVPALWPEQKATAKA